MSCKQKWFNFGENYNGNELRDQTMALLGKIEEFDPKKEDW